jgi:serine protease Do
MKNNLKTVLIAFVAGILGAYGFHLASNMDNSTSQHQSILTESGKIRSVKRESNIATEIDFTKASALSTPCVVYIKTVSDSYYDEFNLFDFYFGEGSPNRKAIGSGSGVVFTPDGYIVTNYHVIESAEKIEVIHEKKTYMATVVGTDPSADLAIIKIEAKNLPAIKRGSSKNMAVGEWVIAVGNPFNLTSTVTAGIVSAKGRDIGLLGGQFPLESFIQTDAAINPGNSGGALVNIDGELVGINTAILSRTGSYTGYGFAVPVDIVVKIFNDLIQHGEVQKAFSGLTISDINTKLAEQYKLKTESFQGGLITTVEPNSQVEKLGISEGDIILKINEDAITGKSSFEEIISYYRPGDKITITYLKGSQTKQAQITLMNKEGTTDVLKSEIYSSDKIGADLEPVSKIEREKLGIQSGVRVVKIKRGLFARLRIQEGFIITAINKEVITKPEQLEDILSNVKEKVYIEGIDKNGVRGYYSFYF